MQRWKRKSNPRHNKGNKLYFIFVMFSYFPCRRHKKGKQTFIFFFFVMFSYFACIISQKKKKVLKSRKIIGLKVTELTVTAFIAKKIFNYVLHKHGQNSYLKWTCLEQNYSLKLFFFYIIMMYYLTNDVQIYLTDYWLSWLIDEKLMCFIQIM